MLKRYCIMLIIFAALLFPAYACANDAPSGALLIDAAAVSSDTDVGILSESQAIKPKKTVSVFIQMSAVYTHMQTPKEIVAAKLEDLLPKDRFSFLPFEHSELALTNYIEDNGGVLVDGNLVFRPSRKDLQTICNNIGGVDYALIVVISQGTVRSSASVLSTIFTSIATCEVRLLEVPSGQYVARAKGQKEGKSSTPDIIFAGAPTYDRAYYKAVKNALEDLKLDLSEI